MKKRLLSILVSVTMFLSILPYYFVYAEDNTTPVDIVLSDSLETDSDKGYEVSAINSISYQTGESINVNVLIINKSGSYKITQDTNTTKLWSIEVKAPENGLVTLTLSNLNLDLSNTGYQDPWSIGVAALSVSSNCNTTINFEGTNILKSGLGRAGIENKTYPITIQGDDNASLESFGGIGGAGIGGGQGEDGSNITINQGKIVASSSVNSYNYTIAAGIGGGYNGNGTNITITGGQITANGGKGAGIGGGGAGYGKNINITGGNITASATDGAGIGGGQFSNGSDINITGGSTKVISQNGAGIGGGQCAQGNNISISGENTNIIVAFPSWPYNSSAAIGGGSGWNQPGYYPGSSFNISIDEKSNVKDENGSENLKIGGAQGAITYKIIDQNGNFLSYDQNGVITVPEGGAKIIVGENQYNPDRVLTVSEGSVLDLKGVITVGNGGSIAVDDYQISCPNGALANMLGLVIYPSSGVFATNEEASFNYFYKADGVISVSSDTENVATLILKIENSKVELTNLNAGDATITLTPDENSAYSLSYKLTVKEAVNNTNNPTKAGDKDVNSDGIISCEEEMNSKSWIWSNTKKACVYKVSNTKTR